MTKRTEEEKVRIVSAPLVAFFLLSVFGAVMILLGVILGLAGGGWNTFIGGALMVVSSFIGMIALAEWAIDDEKDEDA